MSEDARDVVRYGLSVVGLAAAGGFVAFIIGAEYCFHLLNTGRIYDEASYIPPDIADGSAYGIHFAQRGFLLCLAIAAIALRSQLPRKRATPADTGSNAASRNRE